LRRITIFDTTLRDGEQSPGIALQPDEKAAIAIQLERLGVDVIEAGFAASSPGDHAGVAAVAEAAERATVASLCRASEEDIDAAADALAGAQRSRLHVFMATSPIHMEHKLGLTPPEVVERVRAAISYAVARADEVEFSAEDATRSEPAFLAEVCREAIAAGATTINLPDTVGYSIPDEFARFLRNVMRLCPELRRVRLSVHCHDDLGLAVANALAGEAGIHQDGMLKDERTYQIIDPRELGVAMTLPLGKHSGRHAFARACAAAGMALERSELEAAFRRFKSLADSRRDVSLADVFEGVPA
jgi:2-isopropylmalate synthase